MLEALTTSTNSDCLDLLKRVPQSSTFFVDKTELNAIALDLIPKRNSRVYSSWIDTSTTSPANLALASVWLSNCLINHRPCQQAQRDIKFPRRIINISDPSSPFLENGENKVDQYVTLSYKWGQSKRYVTTTNNLKTHMKEIPIKDLPQTFIEAIKVASILKFRWLWIDALCIIQDSKADQDGEIGKMDEIFQFSTLTLFAAAGQNADAGLSVTRDPRWFKPCRLNLKATLDGTTVEGRSYVTLDYDREPQAPLFTRGWVLQEEILATRGLIFGNRELAWRCLCGSATESYPQYKGSQGVVKKMSELATVHYERWREYPTGWDGFNILRM